MTDQALIAVYVVIDDRFQGGGHRDHPVAQLTDAAVLTGAVVAALAFQTHHARALARRPPLGYLSGTLRPSRFNRRLPALGGWLDRLVEAMSGLFRQRAVYLSASVPLPGCRRVRAYRCGNGRGLDYGGDCAAKQEKFFGDRLHVVCTIKGVPVAVTLLPAS